MSRLNITQLATLREFARRGTMAAAADELGYTPGAVSQQLSELERAVGVPLITKVGRRAVLTDAGRALVAQASRVLAAEERAREAVLQAGETISGSLVLGTWGSSAAALLAPLLKAAAERFPALTIATREVDADLGMRDVVRGNVDLTFGLEYPEAPLPRDRSVTVRQLMTERFWIAGGAPIHRLTPVSIADLADEPWILPPVTVPSGRVFRDAFRKLGVEPNVRHEINDIGVQTQMAAQGLGLTFATDLYLHLVGVPNLGRTPTREVLERQMVMVAPAARSMLSATEALIDLAAEVVPRAGGLPPEPVEPVTAAHPSAQRKR